VLQALSRRKKAGMTFIVSSLRHFSAAIKDSYQIGSALRNWTNGGFRNGTKNPAGAPSLYGANFQSISFSQQNYGYLDAAGTPNATLEAAFEFIDSRLGTFLDDLQAAGKLDSTLLLLGAKHGQGPINPATLVVSDPSTVVDGAGVPVAFFVGEDGGIVSPSPTVT